MPSKELMGEFMMNALRLNAGFSQELLLTTTGMSFSSINSQLAKANQLRLITFNENFVLPTRKGRHHLNELVLLFF